MPGYSSNTLSGISLEHSNPSLEQQSLQTLFLEKIGSWRARLLRSALSVSSPPIRSYLTNML